MLKLSEDSKICYYFFTADMAQIFGKEFLTNHRKV
jgi:hypothetical protein